MAQIKFQVPDGSTPIEVSQIFVGVTKRTLSPEVRLLLLHDLAEDLANEYGDLAVAQMLGMADSQEDPL